MQQWWQGQGALQGGAVATLVIERILLGRINHSCLLHVTKGTDDATYEHMSWVGMAPVLLYLQFILAVIQFILARLN